MFSLQKFKNEATGIKIKYWEVFQSEEGSSALSWVYFSVIFSPLFIKCNALPSFLPPRTFWGELFWLLQNVLPFFFQLRPGCLRLSLTVKHVGIWKCCLEWQGTMEPEVGQHGLCCRKSLLHSCQLEVEHRSPWTQIHLYLLSHVILK